MALHYLIPGEGFVKDTQGTNYLVPGGVFHSESPVGGPTIVEGTGSSVGLATVAAISLALFVSVGASACAATVTGVSSRTVSVVVTSAGTSVVVAQSSSIKSSIGTSQGVATVLGEPVGVAPTETTGSSVGSSIVTAHGVTVIQTTATAIGAATVTGHSELGNFVQGTGLSTGVGTANVFSETVAGGVAHATGLADSDFITGAVVSSIFNASGLAVVLGESPPALIPGNFKPIEQRRVRMPRLPRGGPADQWIDISTREFDSFFNDMHHYFAGSSFIHGVHTELLINDFTLTPETSIIFVMSNESVTSSSTVAIKSISNVPRVIIIVNVGLFEVTLMDGANTIFGGSDLVLTSGRIILCIYTGSAWVGNAI